MIKIFSKKFKTRTFHFSSGKYTVDYCYYRFIPIWYSLNFWFSQGYPGGTECWSTNLWDCEKAERIASGLKSIDDVKLYYKPFEEEEKRWREEEKKYWIKNVPYKTKIINK
jgi:hypothetical protein